MRAPMLAILLAGCAGVTSPEFHQGSQAVRAEFERQVEQWNAAGLDPIQLTFEQRMYALLGCGTLSSLSTVINPTAPTLSEGAAAWCATLAKAAAPAAPTPVPRPTG
jgi:hypothetical protein